jgi:hypothetical protein
MNKEIWKDITGYNGFYQVSNLGSVKSLSRLNDNGKRKYISKERILKPGKDSYGYYQVGLCKNGKQKSMKVHVLVAMEFLGHTPDGTHRMVPDHINDIKTDNRAENLQLITGRQNVAKSRFNMKKSSKYTGVYWHKQNNKWVAHIAIEGKRNHLGLFENELDAHEAYQKALKMYNDGDLSFIKIRKKSSQYKGVSWKKDMNKWVAQIKIDGKNKNLGYFTDEYEAHEAYQKALKGLINKQ